MVRIIDTTGAKNPTDERESYWIEKINCYCPLGLKCQAESIIKTVDEAYNVINSLSSLPLLKFEFRTPNLLECTLLLFISQICPCLSLFQSRAERHFSPKRGFKS
jgi:hypothetical protein